VWYREKYYSMNYYHHLHYLFFSLLIINSLISARNLAENLFQKSTNTDAEQGDISWNSFKPIKNCRYGFLETWLTSSLAEQFSVC
jgi:hypothetical protein